MNFLLASAALGTWVDATFAGFDMAVFQFFGSIRSTLGNLIAVFFTSFGEVSFAVLIALLGLVLIFFKRTRKYGFALVFAIIIGTLVTNVLLKPMFVRVRPYNSLQGVGNFMQWYTDAGLLCESDFCFPSGHTCAATEIGVVLCMLFSKDRKKGIAWLFPVIAFLCGCSRIYLMVHYATDVIASFAVGTAAAVAGYYLSKLICYILDHSRAGERFDLERRYIRKKGRKITKGAAGLAIATAVIFCYMVSFVKLEVELHTDLQRCAYDENYNCYNEAQTGSKYPAIEGEYYCKIHWKEKTE